MFSTVVPQYADVFMEIGPDKSYILGGIILVVFGLATSALIFIDDEVGLMATGVMAVFAVIIGACLLPGWINGPDTNTVIKNMTANVKEKYHADLQVSQNDLHRQNGRITDLDKYQTYKLVFDNGAEGEYRIKFESTGEPMIADDEATAPTAKELNSDTVKASPKTTPTPSELEESAKK